MDKIKRCRNNCIFCFIDQLPEGLRDSLYIKDDDYIHSYEHGNFITLTNLNKKDIENVIKYNLSPLNISFHSASSKTRDMIFRNKNNYKSVDILKILDQNKIKTNIQIVLCRDINDKQELENTIDFLRNNFKNIISIGIVPAGITKFNKNRLLRPYDKITARDVVHFIKKYKTIHPSSPVYLSDEFYILSEIDFPGYRSYKKFYQIENGIGLCADFMFEFKKILKQNIEPIARKFCRKKSKPLNLQKEKTKLVNDDKSENILILTSEYGYSFIKKLFNEAEILLKELLSIKYNTFNFNFNIKVDSVKNEFFGGNVRVCGLLTFSDYLNYFKLHELKSSINLNDYDKILIPDIIFNKDNLTIDDKRVEDFKNISEKIIIVRNNSKELLKEIYKI